MIQLKYGLELIERIAAHNDFSIIPHPIVTVIRNTDLTSIDNFTHIPDTGDNITDSILLLGDDEKVYVVKGRSIPHKKYQKRMIEGTARANYVAPGCYEAGLRKGLHRGKEALVQHKAYIIWRSPENMTFGDEDDYVDQDGFVADNLHGNAPYSAGCITIVGKMLLDSNGKEVRDGDWDFTHDWIYKINKDATFFTPIFMDFDDIATNDRNKWKLRPGSLGPRVAQLQQLLRIKSDGDFGPMTFEYLRKKQQEIGVKDSGIYDYHTRQVWDQLQNTGIL